MNMRTKRADWIRHKPGDPMLCDGGQMIEILDSEDGRYKLLASETAPEWWGLCYDFPIVAWRPIEPEPKPEPKFGEWQPIETAPKDGSSFLIYEGFEPTIESAWIDIDGEIVPCSVRNPFWENPTHWMPMPEHPKS